LIIDIGNYLQQIIKVPGLSKLGLGGKEVYLAT